MSKGANLDSRFRVEAMRKFFSIRRKIEEEEDDRRDTRSPCANSRVIFSRIALNMLPRARMVITAIYCRSMSSFYGDPLSVARVIDGKTSGKTLLVNSYTTQDLHGRRGLFARPSQVKLLACLFLF